MPLYQPSEDSYLLSSVLKKELLKLLNKNPNLKFLEIGCGRGIQIETAFSAGVKKKNIVGSDINEKAVDYCRKLGFNVINSNLFQNIKGKFDLIIFNPPYLPLDKNEPKESQRETTGGKKGSEISVEFLKQTKNHLEKNGKIFLITSSLAEEIDFEKLDLRAKKVGNKKLFFEELWVWKLERKHENV